MELKKDWEDYTKEEQTTLLNHWFYYYGGIIMTLKDIEDFRLLSATRQDEIFNHIVTNYIFRHTIQSNLLVACMRENKVDELFNHSLKREDLKPGKEEAFNDIRKMLSSELITTFIDPQPSIPMDIGIVVEDEPRRKK